MSELTAVEEQALRNEHRAYAGYYGVVCSGPHLDMGPVLYGDCPVVKALDALAAERALREAADKRVRQLEARRDAGRIKALEETAREYERARLTDWWGTALDLAEKLALAHAERDAAKQDAARWASDAAALREEKLIELALHAEEVAALRERVATLEGALTWYADAGNYDVREKLGEPDGSGWRPLKWVKALMELDRGERARVALAAPPQPAGEQEG